jgi:putative hydrolase of the HAD superfamily
MAKALLFDVGDVMMLNNWEMLDDLEQLIGRPIPGRGPYAPDDDPDWHDFLVGRIDNYAYWDRKAQAAGLPDGITLFGLCSGLASIFAPDAMALIAEARAAGVPVGILSNDLVRIAGPGWTQNQPELQGYDVFVDATVLGVRKPEPEGYLKCIADFGLPADEIVFLDDTPECVEGARAVGMIGVHVDPTNRAVALQQARQLVGLAPPTEAWQHVRAAEKAYGSRDLEAVMPLFHPQIVIRWNGQLVASGLAQARQFHIDRLGFGGATRRHDYRLTKTLRAADGDTICVEWESSYRRDDGTLVSNSAGEFWIMRYGLLIEWHAYNPRSEEQ